MRTDRYVLGLGSDEDMENTLLVGPVKLLLSSVDFFSSGSTQPPYSLFRAASASVFKRPEVTVILSAVDHTMNVLLLTPILSRQRL